MAQINGTSVLVYNDGTLIAVQTDCTINVDQDLIPTTNKSSSGWATHINGLKAGSVSCAALYSSSGKSSDDLLADIIGLSSVLLVVSVNGTIVVAEADIASSTIEAGTEVAATINAEFVATGGMYMLTGDFAELITEWTNGDYDTFTTSGTGISSGINAASTAYANSDAIDITDEDVVKVFSFLTLTSGEAPYLELVASAGGSAVSDQVQMTEGVSVTTLTATATDSTSYLEISNTGASNFAIGTTYVFKA